MKIFHTADLHLGTFPGPELEGENVRFSNMKQYFDNLVREASMQTPDLIIIAGDLFHQAKVWSDRGLREQAVIVRFLRQMLNVAPVFVLRGTPNHDSQEQFSTLENTFLGESRLTIATKADIYRLQVGNEQVNIVALPGFHPTLFDAELPENESEGVFYTKVVNARLVELLQQCPSVGYKIVVGHYTITGCSMESGQTAFFSNSEPVVDSRLLDTLSFDLGCFGHIHKPQRIGSKSYYSGAIARMNFNDEGQARGYYLHELTATGLQSTFVELPSWEFVTVRLGDKEVGDIIDGVTDMSTYPGLRGKIVRVLYTCTDVHNKMFSPAVLERQLYKAGAFYVYEISPVAIQTSANVQVMTSDNSPIENLMDYLSTQDGISVDDIGRMCNLVQPLLDEAVVREGCSHLSGVFMPVEIRVHNYRNYEDEYFDYNTIQFCTINGQNGVGKSSLFMDAVVDALYEDPREGELTGWIRNDPSVKSGSIQFTFRLGDTMFRVTRSRRRSGSPSLKLEQFLSNDWRDISKTKTKDTQQAIEDIVGMDVTTFKSCALIMQDQYGLFLSADKENRMEILGNLLGLGVYDTLETLVGEHITVNNRDIRAKQQVQAAIKEKIPDMDALSQTIGSLTDARNAAEKVCMVLQTKVAGIRAQVELCKTAQTRVDKLEQQIRDAQVRQREVQGQMQTNVNLITQARAQLCRSSVIDAGVVRYNEFLNREKDLLVKKTQFEALRDRDRSLRESYNKTRSEWDNGNNRLTQLEKDIAAMNTELTRASGFQCLAEEDIRLGREWDTCTEALAKENQTKQRIMELTAESSKLEASFRATMATIDAKIEANTGLMQMMKNSGCVDVARASCQFLASAKRAEQELPALRQERDALIASFEKDKALFDRQIADLQAGLTADTERRMREIQARRVEIAPMLQEYAGIQVKQQQLAYMQDQKAELRQTVENAYRLMEQYRLQINELQAQAVGLTTVEADYAAVVNQIAAEKHWVDEKAMLPVWETKMQTAQSSVESLQAELNRLQAQLEGYALDLRAEQANTKGASELHTALVDAQAEYDAENTKVQQLTRELGVQEKTQLDAKSSIAEADRLQTEINALAQRGADYELLKKAFSIDGIRHSIVCNIIPVFEATASAILSQMSGGSMRVEFATTKVLKTNKKKEVTALDIIINDSATGKLPYMSRSGGERVKAALSVILALAEIKSSRAGVQLGFLGIDEPPYLDATGAQAYCDALFAIQARYPEMKIMAITHDPSMKGRFPQNVDIVKTDRGSKVKRH